MKTAWLQIRAANETWESGESCPGDWDGLSFRQADGLYGISADIEKALFGERSGGVLSDQEYELFNLNCAAYTDPIAVALAMGTTEGHLDGVCGRRWWRLVVKVEVALLNEMETQADLDRWAQWGWN